MLLMAGGSDDALAGAGDPKLRRKWETAIYESYDSTGDSVKDIITTAVADAVTKIETTCRRHLSIEKRRNLMASLYLRGEAWWAKYRQGGRVIRTSTGCTKKKAAQDWLDVRAGRIAEGPPLSVGDDRILFDELRADLSHTIRRRAP